MTREEIYSRFEELDKRASLGGGVDKIEKQHAQGKMTARERIGMLLDKGTFNELDKAGEPPLYQLRHGEEADCRRWYGHRLRKDRRPSSVCLCI